jgi:hypothetical protein
MFPTPSAPPTSPLASQWQARQRPSTGQALLNRSMLPKTLPARTVGLEGVPETLYTPSAGAIETTHLVPPAWCPSGQMATRQNAVTSASNHSGTGLLDEAEAAVLGQSAAQAPLTSYETALLKNVQKYAWLVRPSPPPLIG